ncbi:glutaredoxin [Rhizobiaceae bacterium]|nr:glutaredoxin [Rhizobiaceae bacterium]
MSIAAEREPLVTTSSAAKTAVLYRMVSDSHTCPFGLRARDLLERQGYAVEDHPLRSRDETDAFKAEHGVKTTPQTFIGGERVGGYDDLKARLKPGGIAGFMHETKDKSATTYAPILAIFGTAALMALAASWHFLDNAFTLRTVELFVAFAMCILAVQKLRDLDGFVNGFLSYDLLTKRWLPYGYIYPFAEAAAGVLMIAGVAFAWLSAPIALFIGSIGAWSVIKAVYIEKRDIKCACVGGGSNVPLGAISLLENVGMVVMAIWMLVRFVGL